MRQTTFLRRLVETPRTLKFHLVAFAAILVLPLFAFAVLGLIWVARSEMTANEARLQGMATDLSTSIDREITSWLTVLETLGTSAFLETGSYEAFHERARAALRNRDAHVILLDTDFNQLLNTRVPYGTPLPKTGDTESVQIVMNTGRPYVSDAFVGNVSGQTVVNVEMPVFHEGAIRYVMLITFGVSRIQEIARKNQFADGWNVAVSDRKGQVIARMPEAEPAVAGATGGRDPDSVGIVEEAGSDRRKWVEAYRWSATTGWRTSVRVPRTTLDAPFRASLYGLAAVAIVTGMISLLMASFLARRMSRSIGKLRLAASDLAAGRAIEARRQPIAEANAVLDAVREAANVISDRTHALEASEAQSREQVEQIRMLMGELAHRNKNVLAVLQAIARQISRRSDSFADFQENFDRRISALVRSNELLFGAADIKGQLAELIRRQLAPFIEQEAGRIELRGPDVALRADAIQSLGLAFHELATNATKYGSLSTPGGKVVVTWKRRGADGLDITWREEGGPRVEEPTRSGFGRVVIERLTGQNLEGEVDYRFEPSGVVWRLRAPGMLAMASAEDAPAPLAAAGA